MSPGKSIGSSGCGGGSAGTGCSRGTSWWAKIYSGFSAVGSEKSCKGKNEQGFHENIIDWGETGLSNKFMGTEADFN